MVYEWDKHKDTICRLYVDENKQVEEIIEHMRVNHNFKPSKRAYASQFRRWNLPSRQQPALKNEALVARVRELWERNLSQAEMLRVLNLQDGFEIKSRELNRVRSAHRWLLRTPASDARRAKRGTGRRALAHDALPDDDIDDDDDADDKDDDDDDDDDDNDDDGDEDNDSDDVAVEDVLVGAGGGGGEEADKAGISSQVMTQRRLEMEAESAQRWAARKRRRRTRQYAGLPADPPGPPRFPSETTLAESQAILGLDRASYAALRGRFQAICEAAGITKKTLAGPEAWKDAKRELIGAFPALGEEGAWVDNDPAAQGRRRLALDVICSDVTKRMRAGAGGGERSVALADAKNILGLNPAESREVRAKFYAILKRDGFTSKVALGPERWKELKQKWIDDSEMLRKVLSRLDDPKRYEMRIKAVEAIATDVMKRLRDDQNKRRGCREKDKGPAVAMEDSHYDDGAPDMREMNENSTGFAAALLVPGQQPHAHSHPPRMLPSHLVDPQMGMQIPMDNQLGSSLLLDPNAQGSFMASNQQFMPEPAPMPTAPSPYDNSQAATYQIPTANSNLIPIYLREIHPDGSEGDIWIACLTSPTPSFEELRQVAAQKIPGSTCVEVIGMVKVPNAMGVSQLFPLQIHNDDQLGAHLAQEGPPMFHVRLSF